MDEKIGLSLSGGGFRASFFHLGALRRLAQLGLLERVQVLSTVSGGSLLAAHYYLLLKESFDGEKLGPVELIDKLEREFRDGVSKNLRSRLFLPGLRWGLGNRMVRLLDRHLYRQVLERMKRSGGAPLVSLKIEADGVQGGIRGPLRTLDSINSQRAWKIPKLVINATSLNTGGPFRFSIVEMGDESLGMVRHDDLWRLEGYRALAEAAYQRKSVGEVLRQQERLRDGFHTHAPAAASVFGVSPRGRAAARTISAVFGPRPARSDMAARTSLPPLPRGGLLPAVLRVPTEAWNGIAAAPEGPDEPPISDWRPPVADIDEWMGAGMRPLRRAKIAAWYLLQPDGPGIDRATWTERLAQALQDCLPGRDDDIARALQSLGSAPGREFLEFVIDLYLLRLSQVVDPRAASKADKITLTQAAQASACFPPVFSPVRLKGLYSRRVLGTARLTDGGVFDNQGMDALFEEECTHVIASDAGQVLEIKRSIWWYPGMLLRLPGVLMNNVRDLQLANLYDRKFALAETEGLPPERINRLLQHFLVEKAAFFHMGSAPARGATGGAAPHPDARALAGIRTDLDSFTDREIDALIYQGYQLCDRYVRKHLPPQLVKLKQWPEPGRDQIPRYERGSPTALAAGSGLFFRTLWGGGGLPGRLLGVALAVVGAAGLWGLWIAAQTVPPGWKHWVVLIAALRVALAGFSVLCLVEEKFLRWLNR
ncbi:MAG TPA: patatin-like phospholipase family protein [Bdellovibrionota bacterium]|nr:patatin-like phospholipase family protein [Bdellovibrionota bacterium]